MRTEKQTNHNNWLEWHMAIEVDFGEVVLCVSCLQMFWEKASISPTNICLQTKTLNMFPFEISASLLTTILHLSLIPKPITWKASIRARLLHLSFTFRDRSILDKAFCKYVRLLLEYCSLWNPHLKYSQISCSRNRVGPKKIYKSDDPKPAAPTVFNQILELNSLEQRRLNLDLCVLFKLLNGFIKSDLLSFIQFSYYNRTRGHCLKLRAMKHCSANITKIVFFRAADRSIF